MTNFVQKLFRWVNFTPPQLFNVHKKAQQGKGYVSRDFLSASFIENYGKLFVSIVFAC